MGSSKALLYNWFFGIWARLVTAKRGAGRSHSVLFSVSPAPPYRMDRVGSGERRVNREKAMTDNKHSPRSPCPVQH